VYLLNENESHGMLQELLENSNFRDITPHAVQPDSFLDS
jgi:hypothetical protein